MLLVFRVYWYTTMVGKRKTLRMLLRFISALFKKYPVLAPLYIKTTQFMQGTSTRWGFAWTFYDINEESTVDTQYKNIEYCCIRVDRVCFNYCCRLLFYCCSYFEELMQV